MSGHTPGPWRVRIGDRDDHVECDLNICGDIFVLADIGGPQYAHCHPNAYLMAAAPEMHEALLATTASLAAAISLLERGGKEAAPSNRMFDQMLTDYARALELGRAALAAAEPKP